MIEPAALQDLINRWWMAYDAAEFDRMAGLLTEDVRFTCRTDTGTTDFEEFVRADVSGRDEVMAWQRPHRLGSPDPLRHVGANVCLTRAGEAEAEYTSYIYVTQIVGGFPSPLSTAIVSGGVRIERGELRIASMDVVLDTQDSIPLEQRGAVGATSDA